MKFLGYSLRKVMININKWRTGTRGRATYLLKQGTKLKRNRWRPQEYHADFDIMRKDIDESEEEKDESNRLM